MIVDRVINNNIVSTINDEGAELILMGRGLGFGTKSGNDIDESKVEKIFKLEERNDAEQLKQAIRVLRQHGFTGKIGTMIELPSAYFDLERILETGISKIVVGMNDLTSFIFATVRNSQWHDMESPIMLDMLRQIQDKARKNKIDFAVAGYLNTSFIQKMNQMGIECILHYSSIPEIFDLEIDHPDHLKHIKEESKKLQRRTNDTSRNVECLQANQPLYRR